MATDTADNPAEASAATIASSTQPTTSLPAAAEIATTPISLRVRSYSRRMRPRIGTAVMEKAMETNRQ